MLENIDLVSLYDRKSLEKLHDIFKTQGHELRFVGGIVRDALLGKKTADIDLATTLPPEQGLTLLAKNGIKVIPTGIDFGTITAVINNQAYEITTLRKDIETNGRHAIVDYTDDWREDAKRRDFTINAMYVDFEGKIYDYFGGYDDLQNGIIRFVGDTKDRIQEDYLRILRFFRFYARYGHGQEIDSEILSFFHALRHHLNQLSKERISSEILKILTVPDVVKTLDTMNQVGIFEIVLPATTYEKDNFIKLQQYEQALIPINTILRLSLLTKRAETLTLSKQQQKLLTLLNEYEEITKDNLFWHFYQLQPQLTKLVLIRQSISNKLDNLSLLETVDSTVVKEFPLTGNDLIKLGLKQGKELGITYNSCLKWWCQQQYKPSKEDCLSWVLVTNSSSFSS